MLPRFRITFLCKAMPMRSVSPECWWRPQKKCLGDVAVEIGELELCAQWQVYVFNLYVWVHVFVKLGDLRPRTCQKASILSLSYWEASRILKQLIPWFYPFLSHGRTTKSWKNWSWASIIHQGTHDIGTNCVPRGKNTLVLSLECEVPPTSLCIWTLGPLLVVLFCDVVELWRYRT